MTTYTYFLSYFFPPGVTTHCLFVFTALQRALASSSEVSRSHTTTRHIRQDSSGRVISSSQRPLPENTKHTKQTNFHAPEWDSNPRSHQARGRRPTPQNARVLGPTIFYHISLNSSQKMKRVKEIHTDNLNTHFMFNNFFLTVPFTRQCGKTLQSRAGQI